MTYLKKYAMEVKDQYFNNNYPPEASIIIVKAVIFPLGPSSETSYTA